MSKTTTSLVLFLLLVAIFLNGYSVEEVGRANKKEDAINKKEDAIYKSQNFKKCVEEVGKAIKKDDGIYKSQKFGNCVDCMILYGMCLSTPYFWPVYGKFCTDDTNVALNRNGAPKLERDLLP